MYIDYTNHNKACHENHFPLSNIDKLGDKLSLYKMFSFMDEYLGYNQIPTHLNNELITTFMINKGVYCYKIMSFELKNAKATFKGLLITKDLEGKKAMTTSSSWQPTKIFTIMKPLQGSTFKLQSPLQEYPLEAFPSNSTSFKIQMSMIVLPPLLSFLNKHLGVKRHLLHISAFQCIKDLLHFSGLVLSTFLVITSIECKFFASLEAIHPLKSSQSLQLLLVLVIPNRPNKSHKSINYRMIILSSSCHFFLKGCKKSKEG
ncbi:hypothetical protein CR513_17139, partial [Mucuna pruriens]